MHFCNFMEIYMLVVPTKSIDFPTRGQTKSKANGKSIYMQITHWDKCSAVRRVGRRFRAEGWWGGWGNNQIQWCEICMFMRNNIAFLLWKCFWLAYGKWKIVAHRVVCATWQIFSWQLELWSLSVKFVVPTQRIARLESFCFDVDMDMSTFGQHPSIATTIITTTTTPTTTVTATASVLHANCFIVKRNWFNNKFNLSLSIFDTHTWAHNNFLFAEDQRM